MYKNPTEEPKGSFFIAVERSGEFPYSVADARNFEERIISLYDMQEFYPNLFIAARLTIRTAQASFEAKPKEEHSKLAGTDEESLVLIRQLAKDCKKAGMPLSADAANELADHLEKQDLHLIEAIEGMRQLSNLIDRELHYFHFFQLSHPEARSFSNTEPFGTLVSQKFPLIQHDLQEAAKCLCLERSTASIFHLMRAMESVTQQLGKKLRVKIYKDKKNQKRPIKIEDAQWDEITVAVLKAITLPNPSGATKKEREREKRYASIAHNLRNLKDVYRNPVAHPHEFFEREEAETIFVRCKLFLQSVAPFF